MSEAVHVPRPQVREVRPRRRSLGETQQRPASHESHPEGGTAGNRRFGYSVSLDGDTALIGAYGVGGAGAAFIFSKQADGSWTQTATLDSADSEEKDQFGCSVALQGVRAAGEKRRRRLRLRAQRGLRRVGADGEARGG